MLRITFRPLPMLFAAVAFCFQCRAQPFPGIPFIPYSDLAQPVPTGFVPGQPIVLPYVDFRKETPGPQCSGEINFVPDYPIFDDVSMFDPCVGISLVLDFLTLGNGFRTQAQYRAMAIGGMAASATIGATAFGSQALVAAPLPGGGVMNAWVQGSILNTAPLGSSSTLTPSAQYPVPLNIEANIVAADFNGDGNADLIVSTVSPSFTSGAMSVFLGKGDGTFTPGATISSVAAPYVMANADFNGDGKMDLAVGDQNAQTVSVLLGNGDGTFQPPLTIPMTDAPGSIVALDLNGDGHPDIAAVSFNNGTVSVLLGKGDGTFQPASVYPVGNRTAAGQMTYMAAIDLNGDAKPDLVIANPGLSAIVFLFGNGDGSFRAPEFHVTRVQADYFTLFPIDSGVAVLAADKISGDLAAMPISATGIAGAPRLYLLPYAGVTGVAAADLNGDRLPDIVTAGNAVSVLLRQPGGGFSASVNYLDQSSASAVAAGDLNGDGKIDVVAGAPDQNSAGLVYTLLGKGDGTLSEPQSYPIGGSPAGGGVSQIDTLLLADFNGDGKPDVAAGYAGSQLNSTPGGVSVLLGNGNGTLQTAVGLDVGAFSVYGLAAGDFNGDGKPDLAAAVGGAGFTFTTTGAVALFLGKGDGTFQPAKMIPAGSPAGTPVSIAAGDVNRDGKTDLIVSVSDSTLALRSVVVLLGNGDGTFHQLAPIANAASGEAIALVDLNGDGIPDLVESDQESVYLLGNGDGTFQAPRYFCSGLDAKAFAVADWNNNGVEGLAIAGLQGAVMAMQSGINPKLFAGSSLRLFSSAAGAPSLAPGSLASAYGTDLATTKGQASSLPFPTNLNGTTVSIVDSKGATAAAPLLYADSGQVNFYIPPTAATGAATVTITSGDGTESSGQTELLPLAPALFTLNPAGLAAAYAVCISSTGAQTIETPFSYANGVFSPAPINLGACAQTQLELFATGMDLATAANVRATVGGVPAPVTYAGPQGTFIGLDQVNVVVPQSLAGAGNVPVVLTAGGQTSNTVNLTIQ